MNTLLYYTADGRLTAADAVDCAVQWLVEDAVRLGLPTTREPEVAPASPEPEAKHIPAPPEDKMVRARATKARR